MTDIHSYIVQRLEEAKQQIIANMERAGQVVTGGTRDSLVVETPSDSEGVLTGRAYFAALETGSAPSKKTTFPPRAMVTSIQEWLDAKGLSFSAYAVARKILTHGSSLYRNGGRTDVFTPVVEDFEETFSEGLSPLYEAQINTILDNYVKQTKDR